MNLAPGLHEGISHEAYNADPCELSLSRSLASTLVRKSPAHAYLEHPKLGAVGKKANRDMDFGTLCHAMMLGEEGRVLEGAFKDYRKDEAKAWRDAALAAGLIPALKDDMERARWLRATSRGHLEKMGILPTMDRAKKEVTAIFDHEGARCRCRLDALDIDMEFRQGTIYDFKITGSAKPETIDRQIGDMNYDLQGAWYKKAVAKVQPEVSGRTKFILIFIEDEPPYATTPVELSEAYLQIGQLKMDRAVETWKRCLASKAWPSYVESIHRSSPPEWLVGKMVKWDL